ncbi:MAG: hypothetical protein J6Y14_11620 [Fibrobacter sp.]|nr:hypothetical protein [Fibrobacter sp.]
MKILLFMFICITNVIAQSYIYNAYENGIVDERDGSTYNVVETDSSRWLADDLHYIPLTTLWKNVVNGDLFCESDYSLKSFFVDENDNHTINLLKKTIENCRKVYYKWDLAITSCPQGWHLARTEEWIELSAFLEKNPILQNVFFQDYPKYVNFSVKKNKKYIIYEHLSKWWHADLLGIWTKNTRARVTSFRNKKLEVKTDVQFGSDFWTLTPHKTWALLPARCVENKEGYDYFVIIPKIDTSLTLKYGHQINKTSSDAPIAKNLSDLL